MSPRADGRCDRALYAAPCGLQHACALVEECSIQEAYLLFQGGSYSYHKVCRRHQHRDAYHTRLIRDEVKPVPKRDVNTVTPLAQITKHG